MSALEGAGWYRCDERRWARASGGDPEGYVVAPVTDGRWALYRPDADPWKGEPHAFALDATRAAVPGSV